ncbi:fatty acid desaturase [Streptomyces sp. NPDC051567]|uniref:fatty acid desaturase n=1 Tax=Streptomyces sp. NPDC051567 TaxID=3365660 RepID=UPI003791FDE9
MPAPVSRDRPMLLALSLIALGIVLRQADRVHYGRRRPRTADAAGLIALQRARANDVTPLVLLAGQWVQIAGWWLLAAQGPLGAAVASAGVAVQFRHLQELSHHAVHGVLARTGRANTFLAEVFAHLPLGLPPVPARRRRHVRDHHPHATLAADPNLAELTRAGLRPGIGPSRFALAVVHPLTPAGLAVTVASLRDALRPGPGRLLAFLAVPAAALLLVGWPAAVFGWLVPRLLLYPLLAWWSLFAEHTWFDPEHRTGSKARVEAGRCLRLYPRSRALAALATATWLPYGDLHHYAHSAHPGLRWNYLPALERHLGPPHFAPDALALGTNSVARRHYRALTATSPARF